MIKELLENKEYQAAYLEIINLHPHDQAILINELEEVEQELLLSFYNDNELSSVLAYLTPEESAEIITDLSIDRQKDIIEQMDLDDAVDLIDELDTKDQEAILNVLEKQEELTNLLNYEDDEAGSIMTPNFIKVLNNIDIKDAMRSLINQAPNVESVSTLFITNEEGKYLGTVNLNVLIKAKSPMLIDNLITSTPIINDTDDISMAIHIMREYGLYEIAVNNDEEKIIGIITLDDAIERYEAESVKDFANLSAISDYEEKSLLKASLHRLPWLLILLLASIPIALSTSMFEEIIVAVSILALFQPLILDASGDVATQTLAVTLRKLNQTDGASIKDGIKEVTTGAINGLILGLTSALITYFMAIFLNMNDHAFSLAIVVGLSLLLTVIIGPILGFLVPVFLNKIKLDPAVASGPFITTLVDILSLVIYFGLATLLLGGIL